MQEQIKPAEAEKVSENRTAVPESDLLKVYNGVKTVQKQTEIQPVVENNSENTEKTSYDRLITLPNVKDTFKHELAEVAKFIDRKDSESVNTERLVNQITDGKIWRGTLRYFCDNSVISKPMENDLNLINTAAEEGTYIIDAYVPKVADKNEGLKSVKVGDTFEVDGEKNIYFKDSEGEAHQLKLSKQTFAELFPPAKRFSCTQGA